MMTPRSAIVLRSKFRIQDSNPEYRNVQLSDAIAIMNYYSPNFPPSNPPPALFQLYRFGTIIIDARVM